MNIEDFKKSIYGGNFKMSLYGGTGQDYQDYEIKSRTFKINPRKRNAPLFRNSNGERKSTGRPSDKNQRESSEQHNCREEKSVIQLTRKGLVFLIALILLGSGVFGYAGSALQDHHFSLGNLTSPQGRTDGYTLEDATGSSMTVQEIVDETENSVVEIKTESVSSDSMMSQYVTEGAGSGVIIKENGYIVTNNHVINGAGSIKVTLKDGNEYSASIVGVDTVNDIAVIKISASGLDSVTYGNSDQLDVGDMAVVIGDPLGELGGTVTSGIISALDREIEIDGEIMTLLQTDASVNPGNSGGALFNQYGQLVGIICAKSSGSDVEGLGFAIPVNQAAKSAQEIIEHGSVKSTRPTIGVKILDLTDSSEAAQYGVEPGLYINEVNSKNAQKSGLAYGDKITSVAGKDVDSFARIKHILSKHSAGDTIDIVVERGGQKVTCSVKLSDSQD